MGVGKRSFRKTGNRMTGRGREGWKEHGFGEFFGVTIKMLSGGNIVGRGRMQGTEVNLYRCGVALQANKSDASRGEWRRTMLEGTNDVRKGN